MIYRKISQNSEGLKGTEIHFYETNDKGLPWLSKIHPRQVTHLALQKKFKELRKHFLSLGGQTNADMKEDIAANYAEGALVKTIEFKGDAILLQGTWERFKDNLMSFKTVWVTEESGYHDWEELRKLADEICEETTQYINGTVRVSDAETIAMWAAAKGKTITMEEIAKMPTEELIKFSTMVLEKGAGANVLLPGEFEVTDEHMEGAIQEAKSEFDLSGADVIDMGKLEEKKSKKQKQEETF